MPGKSSTAGAGKKDGESKGNTSNPDERNTVEEEQEETVWQTLSSHWLAKCFFPFVMVLFAQRIHRVRHLVLQTAVPAHVHEKLPLMLQQYFRDTVVGHYQERQVLIVGSMSSGTRQAAEQLEDLFGYEIGHELSDATTQFVRDGTVSWFFGIRFLVPPETNRMNQALGQICLEGIKTVGFHPRMYQPSVCDETPGQWNPCWTKECAELLYQEWGCALHPRGCRFQPFRRTLHQTRHPLRLVESLVAKYCDSAFAKEKESFVKIATLLFGIDPTDSCLQVATRFVIEYNQALLQARHDGRIQAMYPIETTTPCQLAHLAGFNSTSDVVYPPNQKRFQAACDSPTAPGHQIQAPKKSHHNKGKSRRIRLEWNDLEQQLDSQPREDVTTTLVHELKEMVRLLGYDE